MLLSCEIGLSTQMSESRGADSNCLPLLQLRVCGQWLLSVAGVCESRIGKGFSVFYIACYCARVRVKLGSSGVGTSLDV